MSKGLNVQSYHGFTIAVVPRGSLFGYEIGNRTGLEIRSSEIFATLGEAEVAARRFVDDVDRRVGLGPVGGPCEP